MLYLLTTVRSRERDRSGAFLTMGYIAIAIKLKIMPTLPKIMEIIKSSLPFRVSIACTLDLYT